NVAVILSLQYSGCLRKGSQHQPVQGGQYFVVTPRLDAMLARLKKHSPATLDYNSKLRRLYSQEFRNRRQIGIDMENVLPLKVARGRYVEVATEKRSILRPQQCLDLRRRPDEELPFFTLAVGVLRRIETTTRISHLAPNVVKRLRGDLTIELIAGDLISVE